MASTSTQGRNGEVSESAVVSNSQTTSNNSPKLFTERIVKNEDQPPPLPEDGPPQSSVESGLSLQYESDSDVEPPSKKQICTGIQPGLAPGSTGLFRQQLQAVKNAIVPSDISLQKKILAEVCRENELDVQFRICEKPDPKWPSLEEFFEKRGPVPVPTNYCAQLINDICQSLSLLHRTQIAHRNLTAAVIFFDKHDRLWLTGLDKVAKVDEPQKCLALSDDLHNVGRILYKMATGNYPVFEEDGNVKKRDFPFMVSKELLRLASHFLVQSDLNKPSLNKILLSPFIEEELQKTPPLFLHLH